MIAQADSRCIPLEDRSCHCVVTSPPYWSLRDYLLLLTDWPATWFTPMPGLEPMMVPAWRGCLGLEPTPQMFVAHLVAVMREVWRVLRDDGTCWMNLGDSYASPGKGGSWDEGRTQSTSKNARAAYSYRQQPNRNTLPGLKQKDLCGIPWRVAFALQANGWYLRSDIIWHKPNPMPESVTDRPTKAHEYLFLLTKRKTYFYDAEAVRETCRTPIDSKARCGFGSTSGKCDTMKYSHSNETGKQWQKTTHRNRRTVWTIPTHSYSGAHFATFPPALVEPCILAGTSVRGCCPECGAGWRRIVSKAFVPQEDVSLERGIKGAAGQKPMYASSQWDGVPRGSNHTTTLGWRPGCTCPGLDGDSPWPELSMHPDGEANWPTVPCVVLDPFCGSGTVGQVCRTLPHPRRFVGLDLSGTYLTELALPRAERKQSAAAIAELPLFSS